MSFFQQLWFGISAYKKAHIFIKHHKLWGYVVLPGIINTIILLLTFLVAFHYSSTIVDWILGLLSFDQTDNSSWYVKAFEVFLKIMVWLIFILLYVTTYKYVVLLVMAPVLAFLSERTEQLLTNKTAYFNVTQFLKDVARGIGINLLNLGIEIILWILLFLSTSIPLVGFVVPLVSIIIQSYFIGFGMVDYYCERHRMTIKAGYQFSRKYKGIVIGNGLAFYLIMLIPFVGVLVAPAYSVIAATLAVCEAEKQF